MNREFDRIKTMPDSTEKYVIRAADETLADGIYYMPEPFYEGASACSRGEFEPAEDDIAYQWATHPSGAHQYASEAEARQIIRKLPTHANPKVIPFDQSVAEHNGNPEKYPFNVKFMLTDEQKNKMDPEGKATIKFTPFTQSLSRT